jgi:hypothetical protein
MVRNLAVASGRQVSFAPPPGGEDGGSPMSETKRDYEVGHGKPPPRSRLKNGQSGNPCGPHPKSLPASLVAIDNEIATRRGGLVGGE